MNLFDMIINYKISPQAESLIGNFSQLAIHQ